MSVYPTRPVPCIAGGSSIVGSPSPAIVAVAGEVSETVPLVASALTWTRSAWPTSPETSAWVEAVAPEMFSQPLPYWSQRCHW
jgi:hypothetical protein